jgi:Fe2+ or Zn2+ uptake regulation protein
MGTNKFYKLFEMRKDIRQLEKRLGFDSGALTDNERAMLEYIASRKGTRITDISKEEYFNEISFSTIKRCVITLQTNKLVKRIKTDDNRDHVMVIDLI